MWLRGRHCPLQKGLRGRETACAGFWGAGDAVNPAEVGFCPNSRWWLWEGLGPSLRAMNSPHPAPAVSTLSGVEMKWLLCLARPQRVSWCPAPKTGAWATATKGGSPGPSSSCPASSRSVSPRLRQASLCGFKWVTDVSPHSPKPPGFSPANPPPPTWFLLDGCARVCDRRRDSERSTKGHTWSR